MARGTTAEERESTAAGLFEPAPLDVPRIAPAELAALLDGPEPPLVLDVRSRSNLARDPDAIPGSLRVLPDEVAEWAATQAGPRRPIVTYCT